SSPGLAQLLAQLRYTPQKKRRKQLEAAEKLFEIIQKDKEYPFEFVCFRITGFHLKQEIAGDLIKGDELLEDLRVFISKLSGQIAKPASEQKEKIYTVEELAKTMGVSTKTIYRWRKLGLIAEKFVFHDGTKRLGFLQSFVDRFLEENPQLTGKAKSFERLTSSQKQFIVKKAAKLAATTDMSRYRIIEKISAETGKCHETVRYILLNYDKANPDRAVFKRASGVISPSQAAELYKLYKQGCDIKELMQRFERNRSSIYRIINKRRAKVLLAKKIEFVASEEFFAADASSSILSEPSDEIQPLSGDNFEPFKLAGGSLTEYLNILKSVPVLNRESEVELFRRYNYLKYLACRERDEIKPAHISGKKLGRIEQYLSEAENIQRRIIEANLGLVVGVARKHISARASMLDLVSEGNVSLMRAVEKFDYTKGFRFTTFASWTIAKDFARKIPAQAPRMDKTTAASLASFHRDLKTKDAVDFAAIERAHKSLANVIKDNLTERERYIIMNRYGLFGSPIKKKTKTLIQIGEELGLSKERIRQIELGALQKLRQSLSVEEFELLTG
ncbi:MAG: sigma-70 family RNA polymerase sigma factor, partial [Sedimentisphaerales bacterium]|nr:sigma-70 family RNA polymerase sigma factor [Sedimentisphaerales bacterium]